MKRRDFIKLMSIGLTTPTTVFSQTLKSLDEIDTDIQNQFKRLDRRKRRLNTLDEQIDIERKIFPDTRSRGMILEHNIELNKHFKQYFQDAANIYGIKPLHLEAISSIEQGKPYPGFSSGTAVSSPTGPRGIPQIARATLMDTLDWHSKLIKKKVIDSQSPLNTFTEFLETIPKGQNKYWPLKHTIDSAFKADTFKFQGKEFDSAEFQIHLMGAHYNHLLTRFNSEHDAARGAYNNGSGLTRRMLSLKDRAVKGKVNILDEVPERYSHFLAQKPVQVKFRSTAISLSKYLIHADPYYSGEVGISELEIRRFKTLNSINNINNKIEEIREQYFT